jgi:hypothetical protein
MKLSILGLVVVALTLTTSLSAAEELRTYKKDSNLQATITIQTEETDSTQAAIYVDEKENKKFIDDLLSDPNSLLAQLKSKIELENCEANSTLENTWIDGCGEVTVTEFVRTSFGRGGWASAGASYTFFVGFTSDGTGRFFDVSHMVTISESADAQTNNDGDYNGIVIKTLTLDSIKSLNTENNN